MTPEEEDKEHYAQQQYAQRQAELRSKGMPFDANAMRSLSPEAREYYRRKRANKKTFGAGGAGAGP